jgi:selenocysteine lyase/cysteine desulfurase
VKEICDLARKRGIITVVDGAHAYAHFPFKITDFDCDYYGSSLHKWLLAPIGTGLLYVRPDRIAKTWALQPASAAQANNIRKFEEIGTHPAANHNAIAEALVFHRGIGSERKAARLGTKRWATQLTARSHPAIRAWSPLVPSAQMASGHRPGHRRKAGQPEIIVTGIRGIPTGIPGFA